MSYTPSRFPACYGHRGASAGFPENTLSAFEGAIRDGSDGIESDVHICSDDVIVMFHDVDLERTTDGTGKIPDQPYHGALEHVRTREEPRQRIPRFDQALELIMKPENRHVSFNIDVKPDNPPERLFRLMHALVSKYPDFETTLAPRLILGLWHPKFLPAARAHMPYASIAHIGMSVPLARKFFWSDCATFSMSFAALVGADGQAFRRECKTAGKALFVWTVNSRYEMIEASKWGVDGIITDRTSEFIALRTQMSTDFDSISRETGPLFGWSNFNYWSLPVAYYAWQERRDIESRGGPFQPYAPTGTAPASLPSVRATA